MTVSMPFLFSSYRMSGGVCTRKGSVSNDERASAEHDATTKMRAGRIVGHKITCRVISPPGRSGASLRAFLLPFDGEQKDSEKRADAFKPPYNPKLYVGELQDEEQCTRYVVPVSGWSHSSPSRSPFLCEDMNRPFPRNQQVLYHRGAFPPGHQRCVIITPLCIKQRQGCYIEIYTLF